MRSPVTIVAALVVAAALGVAATMVRHPQDSSEPPRPSNLKGLEAETAALIEDALRAVERDASQPRVWMELAMVYEAAELWPFAERAYREALARRDDLAQPWYHLALVLEATGDAQGALDALQRAARLRPDYAPIQWRCGFLHLDQGRMEDAEASFRRGLRIDPANEPSTFGLVRVLLERDAAAEAVALLDTLAPGPNASYAAVLMSAARIRLHGASGSTPPAATAPVWHDPWAAETRFFQRAWGARMRQAVELLQQGEYADAIVMLEDLRRRRPEDPAVVVNLAAACRAAGRLVEAQMLLETALLHHGDQAALHVTLAGVHFDLGDMTAALRVADGAVTRHPQLPAAHETRGVILLRSGRAADALAALDRSLALDPLRRDAQLGRIEALLALGRADEAGAALKRARILLGRADARLDGLEQRLSGEAPGAR